MIPGTAMALSKNQQMILSGLGIGVVVGVIIGALGAYLGLPAGVRGALTGVFVVVGLSYMRKRMNRA